MHTYSILIYTRINTHAQKCRLPCRSACHLLLFLGTQRSIPQGHGHRPGHRPCTSAFWPAKRWHYTIDAFILHTYRYTYIQQHWTCELCTYMHTYISWHRPCTSAFRPAKRWYCWCFHSEYIQIYIHTDLSNDIARQSFVHIYTHTYPGIDLSRLNFDLRNGDTIDAFIIHTYIHTFIHGYIYTYMNMCAGVISTAKQRPTCVLRDAATLTIDGKM